MRSPNEGEPGGFGSKENAPSMSRVEEVLEAYEAWDPDIESASGLAQRLGISKARLYQILDEEGVTPKARRPRSGSLSQRVYGASRSGPPLLPDEQVDLAAEEAIAELLARFRELRSQLAEHRRRFGPLDD